MILDKFRFFRQWKLWFSHDSEEKNIRQLKITQARAEGGGRGEEGRGGEGGVLEHLPLFPLMPKVSFCQGNFFFFFFFFL